MLHLDIKKGQVAPNAMWHLTQQTQFMANDITLSGFLEDEKGTFGSIAWPNPVPGVTTTKTGVIKSDFSWTYAIQGQGVRFRVCNFVSSLYLFMYVIHCI